VLNDCGPVGGLLRYIREIKDAKDRRAYFAGLLDFLFGELARCSGTERS